MSLVSIYIYIYIYGEAKVIVKLVRTNNRFIVRNNSDWYCKYWVPYYLRAMLMYTHKVVQKLSRLMQYWLKKKWAMNETWVIFFQNSPHTYSSDFSNYESISEIQVFICYITALLHFFNDIYLCRSYSSDNFSIHEWKKRSHTKLCLVNM